MRSKAEKCSERFEIMRSKAEKCSESLRAVRCDVLALIMLESTATEHELLV